MPWTHSTSETEYLHGKEYDTHHWSEENGDHSMHIQHSLKPPTGHFSHSVRIYLGKGADGRPRAAYMLYPGHDGAAIIGDQGLHVRGPAPSERLRSQIENHHINVQKDSGAWMALLDNLAEEYPDLDPAVSQHTAARYSHDS